MIQTWRQNAHEDDVEDCALIEKRQRKMNATEDNQGLRALKCKLKQWRKMPVEELFSCTWGWWRGLRNEWWPFRPYRDDDNDKALFGDVSDVQNFLNEESLNRHNVSILLGWTSFEYAFFYSQFFHWPGKSL